jgi:hypothetical protein
MFSRADKRVECVGIWEIPMQMQSVHVSRVARAFWLMATVVATTVAVLLASFVAVAVGLM